MRASSGSGSPERSCARATREPFLRAAELARREGRPELLAEAALGIASRYAEGSVDPEAVALLEEALEQIPRRDDLLVVKLLAALATNLYFRGEEQRTRELSRAALDMAHRLDDPEALVVALQSRHTALLHASNLEERLRVGREWLELAARIGARELEALGLYATIYDRMEAADNGGRSPR